MNMKVMKRMALAALMILMVCVMGTAMAEAVETHSQETEINVNGMPSVLFAFPHNLRDDPEAQAFFAKYSINDLTAEELDQKYVFKLEADDSFKVEEDLLQFSKRTDKKPTVALRAVSTDAAGKKVKIVMSSKETGEELHVMEYTFSLGTEWTIDIASSADYERKFVSGQGEVLTVAKGSNLDLSITIQGIGETLDLSYQWIDDKNGSVLATTNPLSLKDIQENTTIIFRATGAKNYMFFINIEVPSEPAPTLSVNTHTSHADDNGVITVTEGETVSIEMLPNCSDSSVEFNYVWKMDEETLDCTSAEYRFVPGLGQNGKTISVTVIPSVEVDERTATTFTYTLNVQERPEGPITANITQRVVIGGPKNYIINVWKDVNINQKFNKDYNNDGTVTKDEVKENVTVDVVAGTGISNVEISPDYLPLVRVEANEQADGEQIVITATNTTGDTYITYCTVDVVGVVRKAPTINAESGAVLTAYDNGDYLITVKEGTALTVTANYEMLNGGTADMNYQWRIMGLEEGDASANGSNSYSFIVEEKHEGCTLELYAESKADSSDWDSIGFDFVVEPADPTLSVTFSAVPAAADGIITVVEGEKVTISAQAVCSDPEVKLSYKWQLNDEFISLPYTTTSYTFTPSLEQDGAEVTAIVTPNRSVEPQTPTHFTYKLKVQEKAEEAEVRTQTTKMIVNGTPSVFFAHPHNKMLPETKEFDKKYLGSLTNEALDEKYAFTVEADNSIKVVWNELKYTGAYHVPAVGIQAINANADGKSVKINMSLKATGKTVHVMEYVFDLQAERSVFDIQCSDRYTHEFIAGMGEVLTVVEGSDLSVTIAHKGIGETLDASNIWINTETDEQIGTGSTFSLTDIRKPVSFACRAMTASGPVEMIFFEVSVVPKSEEPAVPVWNGFGVASDGKLELDELEDGTPVLRAEKGKQITVTAKYEYSGSEYQQIYWNFNNGSGWKALESKTNVCTFAFEEGRLGFTLNDNGPVIDKVIIVEELPTSAPVPTATPAPSTKVEYTEGIPKEAITEELADAVTESLVQEGITKEEIEEKGIVTIIEEKMEETIVEKAAEVFKNENTGEVVEVPEEQTAVYEVTLMYTSDGGKTWEKADEEHWPESGKLDVVLPYPEGTDQYTTKFVVAHMFTKTIGEYKAGEIEYPAVTNRPDGIYFQVSSLSPIALAWTYEPIYATFYTPYESGLTAEAVTVDLNRAGLNSASLIKAKLETEMTAKALNLGKKLDSKQIAMTDVTLKFSEDGAKTWQDIGIEDWNSNTVSVFLPYPEGTNANTHDFMVAHMFANGAKAGQIEYLAYMTYADGLMVEVSSMSPFAIASFEKPVAVPTTGDSATPYLWLLGMMIAAAGCVVILGKRRQNG